jgi:hypothetical protein
LELKVAGEATDGRSVERSARVEGTMGPLGGLGLADDQRVLLAFLRRHTLFDQVPEDRLGVVRVDPDPACDLGGFAARVRLEVGDHFAASGAPRGAFGARAIATFLSRPAFPGARPTAATGALAFLAGRSLQVAQGPFELRLLLAERGDVFFDQSLGLIGLGHVVNGPFGAGI